LTCVFGGKTRKINATTKTTAINWSLRDCLRASLLPSAERWALRAGFDAGLKPRSNPKGKGKGKGNGNGSGNGNGNGKGKGKGKARRG
jgi:hypothetical protein